MTDYTRWQSERDFAVSLLQQYAMWWEPALANTLLHGTERPLAPVFYRIHVVGISGRRATLEPLVNRSLFNVSD
jgi:nitroimidazol reductase NimA-like FMN-containing flavoprotein (pyridoxamine 5'-phosphate oxidase superfamily)